MSMHDELLGADLIEHRIRHTQVSKNNLKIRTRK